MITRSKTSKSKNTKKSKNTLKTPKFSKKYLLFFGFAFVLIGGFFAYRALAITTSVTYRNSLTPTNPAREYKITAGIGEVSAYIESRSGGIDLIVLNNKGDTVATLDSSKTLNRRNKIKFESKSDIYTFKISSKDAITSKKSYRLKINYPVKSSESPTAIITSPQEGESLSGKVSFGATATDDIGVSKVEFYVGTQLISTDNKSPYSIEWDTTLVQNGNVTLLVRSYDIENNMGQASLVVEVNNTPTTTDPEVTDPDTPTDPVTPTDPDTPTDPVTPPPPPPPPTPPTSGSQFFEGFASNTGLDRFNTGVFHRNLVIGYPSGHGGSWTADHDMNCGDPSTQRPLSSSPSNTNLDKIIFTCRDHVMTSMGDVDGYSVVWFSPKATFKNAKKVAWNVNVTDLGARQWWEVAVIPVGSAKVTAIDWIADTANLSRYPSGSVVTGNGPFGNTLHIHANGVDSNPTWQPICGSYALDPEGCASKPIRRPWSITDNGNGTVTVDFDGRKYSVAGKFPAEFEVVFKDHNYTPDKDGRVAGHTWHWDNIEVQ
jgi:hypothetical protein